jgi:CRP-like cAMP-binding protein
VNKEKQTALGELATAAAALAATPTDLRAWRQVAALLHAAGAQTEAHRAYRELGRAASDTKQVAFGVACAVFLREHGDEPGSAKLLEEIAATHSAGSKRIERTRRPQPPLPPPTARTEGEGENRASGTDVDRKGAVQRAEAAVTAAVERAAERRADLLAPTPLVDVLSAADFRELCAVMKLSEYESGDVIIEEGQRATELYWIARGEVEVARGEHKLGELRADAFFGEIALVGGTRRTARVTAGRDTWLLVIPAAAIEQIATRAPHLAEELAAYARARLLATVMRTSELFSRLSDEERTQLLPKFKAQVFEPATEILKRGTPGDGLYVVVSGRCEVRHQDLVVPIGVGDGVGEMSLLSRGACEADVVTTENTVMLYLPRASFDEIAVKHPALLAEVYKLMVQRDEAARTAIIHDASELIL